VPHHFALPVGQGYKKNGTDKKARKKSGSGIVKMDSKEEEHHF